MDVRKLKIELPSGGSEGSNGGEDSGEDEDMSQLPLVGTCHFAFFFLFFSFYSGR